MKKTKQSLTQKGQIKITVIFLILSLIFSSINLFSQSQEWVVFTSGKDILSLADEGSYMKFGLTR